MKSIKKLKSILSVLLIWILLFQSCVAYGPPTALETAAQQPQKTKVKYNNDVIVRCLYVKHEDGQYYGMVKEKGALTKYPLDQNNIEHVRMYSRSRSTIATILTPVIIVGAIIGIAAATYNPTISWSKDL